MNNAVELCRVAKEERADFVAMLAEYLRELDAHELPQVPTPTAEAYASALYEQPREHRIEWIVADGERAGFLVSRVLDDWPDRERTVAEMMECYVAPPFRRRGTGRAAVETWLARQREWGVDLVEASVLSRNEAALAFWAAMGFRTRAVQTVRRP